MMGFGLTVIANALRIAESVSASLR
jgi:hypothetical protein